MGHEDQCKTKVLLWHLFQLFHKFVLRILLLQKIQNTRSSHYIKISLESEFNCYILLSIGYSRHVA